jgi:hypothetical protein
MRIDQALGPGFPVQLVASAHFMRFSSKKTAHAIVSSAAYRKSGGLGAFSCFLRSSMEVFMLLIGITCLVNL